MPTSAALSGLPSAVGLSSTGPATITTDSQIVRDQQAQVGDVQFTRPGVTSTTYAPGASRPVIRGLDSFRVRVQENGIGSQDVSDLGEDHAVPIDPLGARKIEIIRGPGTLRYSSQAIGGIAAASNDRIPDVLPAQGIHGEIRGAGTSVDNGYDGAVLSDVASGNTAFHFDAFGRHADDYRIPGGVQPNSSLRASGEAAGLTRFFDNGFAGIAVQHYESLYHVPGTEAARNNTRIDLEQTKVSSRGEWRPDAGPFDAFRYWFGASNYQHNEIGLGDDGTDGVRATFINREQEARTEASHAPLMTSLGQLIGVIGTDVGHRDIGSAGEAGGLLAPATTDRVAAYVFEQLRFAPTWSLLMAGRIEHDRLAGTSTTFPGLLPDPDSNPVDTPATRNFVPVSVSAALVKELPWNLTATLMAEHKERAPGPIELFARGAHDATGTFEIGNAGLKKEAMNAAELGLRRQLGDWHFEANAYYRKFDGFIFRQFTGILCGENFSSCGDPNGEFKQVTYSQRDAVFRGVELSSQYDVVHAYGGVIGVDGQYDYIRATFADGSNVPRMPPMRAGAGVYWRDANWFARLGYIRAFAQNDPGLNETATPGYNLLKAELSYTRPLADPRSPFTSVTVGMVADNLLNDDIRNSVSFRKDEVLLPGRNFRAFATMRF